MMSNKIISILIGKPVAFKTSSLPESVSLNNGFSIFPYLSQYITFGYYFSIKVIDRLQIIRFPFIITHPEMRYIVLAHVIPVFLATFSDSADG